MNNRIPQKDNTLKQFDKTLKLLMLFLLDIDKKNIKNINNLFEEQKNSIRKIVEGVQNIQMPKIEMPKIPAPNIVIKERKIKIPKTEMPKIEIPKIEMTDYTLLFDELLKRLEKPNEQIAAIMDQLSKLPTTEHFQTWEKEQKSKFDIDSKGRIKVAVDRVGGSGMTKLIMNTSGKTISPATEEKQDNIITKLDEISFPTGTGTNSTRTLTDADTSYSVPTTAPTKNYVLVLYNGSDTDMYWGYENSNANGILLPSGGRVNLDLGANQQIYCYCGSAGKVLTYSLKELN